MYVLAVGETLDLKNVKSISDPLVKSYVYKQTYHHISVHVIYFLFIHYFQFYFVSKMSFKVIITCVLYLIMQFSNFFLTASAHIVWCSHSVGQCNSNYVQCNAFCFSPAKFAPVLVMSFKVSRWLEIVNCNLSRQDAKWRESFSWIRGFNSCNGETVTGILCRGNKESPNVWN